MDFELFAEESHKIALNVYEGLESTGVSERYVPDEYKERFMPYARARTYLAGKRLAYLISNLYGEPSNKVP